MAAAAGVFKQIAIKKEVTYGVLPSAASAQLLRRVDGTFNLDRDSYESNEIRTDFQAADMRLGVARVPGSLNGELSPGSYAFALGSLLKRDFATIAAITGLSITIAAGPNDTWTLTRASGSWLTSGVKIGHVVRLTAGAFNVANSNKNLFVLDMTATVLTVLVLNGSVLVAEGPIATATLSVPGKTTYIPTTGHSDDSYSVEEWYGDIGRSEVYSGVKFTQAQIQLPPSGLATIGWTAAGQKLAQKGAVRYFTSPTAPLSSGLTAAVNGVLNIGGKQRKAVTGLNFTINGNYSGDGVVGSNEVPFQFAGTVRVNGEFSAYFEDGEMPGYFWDESEIGLHVALTTGSAAAADFVSASMSRIKVGSAAKNDGQGGIVRTYPFTALLNAAGGTGTAHEQTTIGFQDSLA